MASGSPSYAAGTAPTPSRSPALDTRAVDWFLVVSVLLCIGAAVRALYFTPVDAMLGDVQKIFYIHVPAAIAGLYIGCGLLAVCSLMYLWVRDPRIDRLAESAAETSLVFLGVVLATGPVWGRSSWGTWWQWEARLTSSLFLWLILLGYLVLRNAVESAEQRARLSAVMGTMVALLVPFVHLTVKLFRGMHPEPVVLKPEKPSLPPEMASTFYLSAIAFLLLFVALLRLRYRWAGLRDERLAREGGS